MSNHSFTFKMEYILRLNNKFEIIFQRFLKFHTIRKYSINQEDPFNYLGQLPTTATRPLTDTPFNTKSQEVYTHVKYIIASTFSIRFIF